MDYDLWKAGYYDSVETEEYYRCTICNSYITDETHYSELTEEFYCSDFCLIQAENIYKEDLEEG